MNLIENIRIERFKSLEDVRLRGCRKFNLLIGRPNVGKSNIIEALSMFSLPYIAVNRAPLTDMLRSTEAPSLFYNGDVKKPIVVDIDESTYKAELNYQNGKTLTLGISQGDRHSTFDIVDLKIKKSLTEYPVFKFYNYEHFKIVQSVNMPFLFPVSGDNLMGVVQSNESLKTEFSSLLKAYGLRLTFDTVTQELKFIKDLGSDTSFIVPFVAIADTLKRLFYYKAAIAGNSGSVIMLEEPEAHSYPPYIINVVDSIIESANNQFFITTHSPYVVNEFLEQKADVAIFIVDYKDGETVARPLAENELQRVYDDGIDLFFNNELFNNRDRAV